MENNLPQSIKKYIRTEKARIGRNFSDGKKKEELIEALYKKFSTEKIKKEDANKGNIQSGDK